MPSAQAAGASALAPWTSPRLRAQSQQFAFSLASLLSSAVVLAWEEALLGIGGSGASAKRKDNTPAPVSTVCAAAGSFATTAGGNLALAFPGGWVRRQNPLPPATGMSVMRGEPMSRMRTRAGATFPAAATADVNSS